MWPTIRQLVENGTTVFLTTQYLEEADRLADEIAILRRQDRGQRYTRRAEGHGANRVSELEFGEEAQLSAAQSARRAARGRPGGLELVVATTGSVAEMADVFIRLKDSGPSRPGSPADRRWTTCSSSSSTRRRRRTGRALTDTWTMTKRSLRRTTRSLDTIITVVLTPIASLLLFVYVFGGALGEQTGSIEYVDFIAPGVIIMTVISGIACAASQHGPSERHHRPLPDHAGGLLVGPEWAGAVDAVQSFSCFLVVVVAFLVGFRPAADPAAWLWFCGLLVLLYPGHHLAGHVLRPAGRDLRRRRLQLHPAAPDLHQPRVRPDRPMSPWQRLCREPADDTDHRNHALAADRGHPWP